MNGSKFDTMPEVPLHELPKPEPYRIVNGKGCEIPSGAVVEVWEVDGSESLAFVIRKPIGDGKQSVLRFSLTREAAVALSGLLSLKLHLNTEKQ